MLRVLIITSILTLPCAHGSQKPSPSAQSASAATCATSPDDDAIYSAALIKVILKDRDDKRQIVLLSQTSAGYPAGMASFTASSTPDRKELLDSVSTETKSDFDAKANLNCDLTRSTELKTSVVFMTSAERDELFSRLAGGETSHRNIRTPPGLRSCRQSDSTIHTTRRSSM
jgi:hypothetical protein